MAYYSVKKEFSFSAAHHLPHLPEGHQCRRQHGHNYRVELQLGCRTLDERGFVVDYTDMKAFGGYIDEHLDHRDLNEVLAPMQTTAERIAEHLYRVAWKLWHGYQITVRVSETPKTWAEFSEQ